jgi:iron complex outermembrane receptor protein
MNRRPACDRATRGRAGVLLLVACSPLPAAAQLPELEAVTVTARKVEEQLGEVPLAIDVVAADAIGTGVFDGLRSLAARLPGLTFESMWGGSNSAVILRGQAQPNAAGDNVGVFVDGVYQAARSAVDVPALDIERIELVRGPQSTLFGHSTFAGAIHYVTRRPAARPEYGLMLEAGTDDYRAASAALSGPLPGGTLAGRLAIATAEFDGTQESVNAPRRALGGYRRRSVAASLATLDGPGWNATLSARGARVESGHPAVTTLSWADYNCGSQDRASGAWSYYCGSLPVTRQFELSPGLPDSVVEAWQVALEVDLPLARLTLESDTSYYRSSGDTVRDFDATASGELLGVCTLSVSCRTSNAPPTPIDRLVRVNQVQVQSPWVEELSQELRLRGERWMLGVVGFLTPEDARIGLGVDNAGLGPQQRLTAYLPGTPDLAGPVSQFDRGRVIDPNATQLEQSRTRTERRTLAVFGSVERDLSAAFRARGELRASFERLEVDNVTANFRPGFGRAIEPVEFSDVTPRVSLEYRREGGMRSYVSAARGARSGGVNPIPALLPEEQDYGPETNWTYELGFRHAPGDRRLRTTATLFYIDWQDVQITGFSNTPGVSNLITRNTGGIVTTGVEVSIEAALGAGWRLALAGSHVDARYRAGSDDPGSGPFCGLRGGVLTSSFCTVGPPRDGSSIQPVVPYIDGNRLQRSPANSWRVTLAHDGALLGAGWRLGGRIDLSGQDESFDRAIGGASFGRRELLEARLRLTRGPWSIEAWGLNLTDEQYLSTVASRGAAFYPTTPRPLDLIHAPGRRFGITLRYGE